MSLMELLKEYRWLAEYMTIIATFCGLVLAIYKCAVFVVEHKRLVVEHEATKRKYQKEKAKKNSYKDSLDAAIVEIENANLISIDDGLAFFAHDPLPRYPICPSCLADDKKIRMIQYGTRIIDEHIQDIKKAREIGIDDWDTSLIGNIPYFGFICIKCKCKLYLSDDALDKLRKEGHKFE